MARNSPKHRLVFLVFAIVCLSTVLNAYTALTPVHAEGPAPPVKEAGTYVNWNREHESATEKWTWSSLAWEFGPYPSYVIVLNNGTEVTDLNYVPVSQDFKAIINVQKAVFTGNTTLGGAGLNWQMDVLNATNPTDTLGWAHLQMAYVNQLTNRFSPIPSGNKSFTITSQVYNKSEAIIPLPGGLQQPGAPMPSPAQGAGDKPLDQNTTSPPKPLPGPYPGDTVGQPFYVWNQVTSRVLESDTAWIIEIVGGFNASKTPVGPYNVQLDIYDSMGNRIDYGYTAWEGTKSPNRKIAVGRPGMVSGGYGESWTFAKKDMQGHPIYSVSRPAPWMMVVNVTAATFSNVTIGFRLNDNVRTYVNVSSWYSRSVTDYGGWVQNMTSASYYWNSTLPVTRTEQVYGPHLEERWLWVSHKHTVQVFDSFWNLTTQSMQVTNRTQEVPDGYLYLIYDHSANAFRVKQGYRYSSYDQTLRCQREYLVLQDLNTSDPTTGFYNLDLDRSRATEYAPGKWCIEFVGSFNNSIQTMDNQYWIQPPTVVRGDGQQVWGDWEHVSWGDFEIAVDRMVAITTLIDARGREVKAGMLGLDPGQAFVIRSTVQGGLKIYDDMDAVGVRLRANTGIWSTNASIWSDVEVRLIYNKDDGTLSSETYNRTGKSLMSYGPYEAWVEINVTGLHYEYNMSTRSWDWVNGTFRQMNLTTVEGWHWSYYALNQTAHALDPSDQGAWINRDKVCLSQDDPAFKVTPSYADLIDANTGIEEGNIVSNLTIAFNTAAPQTRYWWELVYGNLTFGADYSQGWGEHRVTEWAMEPVYSIESSQSSGQKWYVSKPIQPYSTLYNGTRLRVYETPYIVFGDDPAAGAKELIETRTTYDYGSQEEKTEYLLRDPWNPATQNEPRYYQLVNGSKVIINEGYKAVIRDLTLNCSDAYTIVAGSRSYLPNQTTIRTVADRSEEIWQLRRFDPVLSADTVPTAYQLLNGTHVYRDSYMLWNGSHSAGFEKKSWNATLNRWELSEKAYTERSTPIMAERAGKAVFLNDSICVPLRDDGSCWQSSPGGGAYYLIMKNGSRLFHKEPFAVDDLHRIITIDGGNYTISQPEDYYTATWNGERLLLRSGWQGYVRNYYYTLIGESMMEMPCRGASATSWWDLERLVSEGGKIPTVKSIKVDGVVYQIHLEDASYYIVRDGIREPVTRPEVNPTLYYSTINGEEYWNMTQDGWVASYGTYNMRKNQLDTVQGSLVTLTGYDPQSRRWTEWNKYGEDRENSTRYLLTSSGIRVDVYEGRYLSVWPVTIGDTTYYTLDRSDKSESVTQDGRNVWRQYVTTVDGAKVYFDWAKNPASWGNEIHLELPGINYTRLVPYRWENRSFLDRTIIYNVTISSNHYIVDGSGRTIANGTTLPVWGTRSGPGIQSFYDMSGQESGRWLPWDDARQAYYMVLINGSRIYGGRTEMGGPYGFGWNGSAFVAEATQFNYSGREFPATEGGHYLVLIENGTWRRSILETATQWQYDCPSWYIVLKNGTRLDFEDEGYGEIEPGRGWFSSRYTTRCGGSLYWVEGGNCMRTYYSVSYAGEEWHLYDQNLLVNSVYTVPRVLAEYEWPALWLNATSDHVQVDESKPIDTVGHCYLTSDTGTRLSLSAVTTWWTLPEKVRREVFNNPQTPWELQTAYPRYNITLDGQEYFVIDPSPCRGTWQPGNSWDIGRYPAVFQLNGTSYPINYNQPDKYAWRSYSAITMGGNKYELQDQWQWKPVYKVPLHGVSNTVRAAAENIYKEHTSWGPAYGWSLLDMNVQTIRRVMDIIVGTPKEGMWGVKSYTIVPETGALDMDGDLESSGDQYYVRRIHVGTDEQNRTIDRMWVDTAWDPNASRPGDEMHVGSWMGKVNNKWSFSWNETYIWYYASNMTTLSPETMARVRSTLINPASGLPNPGYWEISRMAANMTSSDLLDKAKAENWNWVTSNSHEWEWVWFGTRQDYRTSWNENGTMKTAGIGLQYEYAGLLLYNDTNRDDAMAQSETTHFFMPSKVGVVGFSSPGEEYGNYNDTGSMRLNLTDRINFGVTFTNVSGTLFPYNSEKPRDMWGWWSGAVYGADFAEPNLNNRPTEASMDKIQFTIHFNATTTTSDENNNMAQIKIDERYGQWSINPETIDDRTKQLSSNVTAHLRGLETLQGRSLAASWFVTAFTDTAWTVKDDRGGQVSPDTVTASDSYEVAIPAASTSFATLKMGGSYDWQKPIGVNDTVRTFNVSSYTTPAGTFRQSYMSDSGKSSCGFGITASMYFLTVGFQNWDGSGVYHDPEISTEISKVAYSPPGPEPQGVKTYHQIMVNGISYTIQIQSTSIISGVAYDPARNEIVFTVQGQEAAPGSTTVTIPRPLSPWEDAILAYLDDVPCSRSWTSGMDRLVSLTHGQGGHTVRIALNSPRTATQITCDASPPATSKGLSILISGTLAPMVPDAQVIIETSDDSGNSWTLLTTTRTAASGEYSYEWRPIQAKTCLVRASWQGDLLHKGATSEARTVTIRESGDNLMLMAMVAVGLVVAAGVAAVPIIRRRKESRASV